mmetsp:Transcript_37372/g.64497  ORF Transcript_37372/g.64497 Transcript_37372/m.64497 type:complete len:219 (-) Transcript_37372:153-809(-)
MGGSKPPVGFSAASCWCFSFASPYQPASGARRWWYSGIAAALATAESMLASAATRAAPAVFAWAAATSKCRLAPAASPPCSCEVRGVTIRTASSSLASASSCARSSDPAAAAAAFSPTLPLPVSGRSASAFSGRARRGAAWGRRYTLPAGLFLCRIGSCSWTSSGGHLVTSLETFCPTDPMISYFCPFLPSSSRTSIRIRWTWSGRNGILIGVSNTGS